MDDQVVAPVRIDGGPGGQWHSFSEDGGPQVEIFDKLLDVDSQLTKLGGQGWTSHRHLSWDIGLESSNVMIDLDGCLPGLDSFGHLDKEQRVLPRCYCHWLMCSALHNVVSGH